MNRRRWRLRTGLIGLLSLISLISFLLAGATLFLIRLPQVSRESQEDLRVEVSDLSLRSEAMLGAIQTQLELIATALPLIRTALGPCGLASMLSPIRLARPISMPWRSVRLVVPGEIAPLAQSWAARIALADPVAGSSGMPAVGENNRA